MDWSKRKKDEVWTGVAKVDQECYQLLCFGECIGRRNGDQYKELGVNSYLSRNFITYLANTVAWCFRRLTFELRFIVTQIATKRFKGTIWRVEFLLMWECG